MKPFLALVIAALQSITVWSTIAPPSQNDADSGGQCVGYDMDLSRLRSLSTFTDITSIAGTDSFQATRTYSKEKTHTILQDSGSDQFATPICLGKRHRLQENIMGVPVYGADILVTMNNCLSDDDIDDFIRNYDGKSFSSSFTGESFEPFQSFEGKTFASVIVRNGYIPSRSKEEAIAEIQAYLGVDKDAIGEPTLEVFVANGGDFLAYRTQCIVESSGWTDLVEIVIDAHDLTVLSKCNLTADNRDIGVKRHRRLRNTTKASMSRSLFSCESSASSESVIWGDQTTTCPTKSLYLDDTERTTICKMGLKEADGTVVIGPGAVDDIFWGGTYDCKGTSESCTSVILPSTRDALSDVQFGGILTLTVLREKLGIMGGLNRDSNKPVPVSAYAHYQEQYCNAFYSTINDAVYFGDCNCHTWSPLVSLDIVGHEIFHGVTAYSSNLVYSGQSGGLNEGFSDIFGTVVEFYLDDYNDPPDFTMAEQVGEALRNMEFPLYKSIGSVCDFTEGLRVHYASGALNKAFVKSVRSCEASTCDDLRGCTILLGSTFLYSNIEGLTRTSNFLDAARASCRLIDEFFLVRKPVSECTTDQVRQFIIEGWSVVDVTLSTDCNAVDTCPSSATTSSSTPKPSLSPTRHPTPRPSNPPTRNPTPRPTKAPTPSPSTVPPLKKPTDPPTRSPAPTSTPFPEQISLQPSLPSELDGNTTNTTWCESFLGMFAFWEWEWGQ